MCLCKFGISILSILNQFAGYWVCLYKMDLFCAYGLKFREEVADDGRKGSPI